MSEHSKFVDHDLIDRIDAFLAKSGMSVTAFGLKVTNDRRLLPDIREGRDLRGSTRQKILAFIENPEAAPSSPSGEAAA